LADLNIDIGRADGQGHKGSVLRNLRKGMKPSILRILIMDDNAAVCGTITDVLERQGYVVSSFLELDAGIKAARSGKYNLVLLDIKFSKGKNVLSVISRIRAVDMAPEIVVMTDYGELISAELAVEQGAIVYIIKPASAQNIVDVVALIISHQAERHRPRIARH
jgi:DNA-binding NtrC family response regulator